MNARNGRDAWDAQDARAIDAVLSSWPLEEPWTLQSLGGGNNLSYIVNTPRGRYVLKVYRNTADAARIGYEHDLLTRLSHAGLSFAVVAPLPARSGATQAPITRGDGDEPSALAALFPLLPGQHPDGDDLATYCPCGAALAALDMALERIGLPSPPGVLAPFGELSRIHPLVPDPLDLPERLPLEPTQRRAVARVVSDLLAAVPAVYRSLPWQIVHRDFDASNVLLEGGRVSGVLDFEFAAPDLRVLDLARSLSLFAVSPWSNPDGWQRVVAFASGYRQLLQPTRDEIAAILDLMRCYRAMSLVHREGRRRQGLARESDVVARALALLQQEQWMRERGADLQAIL